MKKLLVATILFFGIGVRAQEASTSEAFPLGKIPPGWSYRGIPVMARQIERFPFEVMGVLQRKLNAKDTLSIYVVMKPVERVGVQPPQKIWSWIDQTFVRQVASVPKTFELDVQPKVGPERKWEYREAKIYRAGVASNLASFHTKGRYHHVFLVLRDDAINYQTKLAQLKDLVVDLQIN